MTFKGFGGVPLEADRSGSADDPAVLFLHSIGRSHTNWDDAAQALVQAGRQVVNLSLRQQPLSGDGSFDSHVEDVRAVLAQLGTRPVVIASAMSGWIAAVALGADAVTLAAGLVLVDPPQAPDEVTAKIDIPTLVVRGAFSDAVAGSDTVGFEPILPNADSVEVEDAALLSPDQRAEALNAIILDFLEAKLPRNPPEFRSGSDARTFRDALGCFATGVTIITAMGADGLPIGLTANSFTSVSLDPPLLLVCVANNANSAAVLETAERFAVNVLQIGQQLTSNRFAGKGEDRFAETSWEVGEFGTPMIIGSLASFECDRQALHEGGDHFILVGHVLRAQFEPRRDPLLYFRGKYRRLHFA